jgi:hypothetical protein
MLGLSMTGEKKNPAQFSFTTTTGVSASTLVSTSITPTGFNGAVLAVVTGSGSPQVRKNSSGSFGSSVTLFPGDTLNVQVTSSGTYNSSVVATVTMGTISASWTVTTANVVPGSQSFTTPGTFNFIPPVYSTITITVMGAGEGGGSAPRWELVGGGTKGGTPSCHFVGGTLGANGGGSSFGPSITAGGGTSAAAGTGSGGNNTNDTNGAAGGTGETSFNDVDCGPTGAGVNGNAGGRAISIFGIGGVTVGANYTVVVGPGGAGAVPNHSSTTAGANGSVVISWS